MIEIVDSKMYVITPKIGKHEKIDVGKIPPALTGQYFHGE